MMYAIDNTLRLNISFINIQLKPSR